MIEYKKREKYVLDEFLYIKYKFQFSVFNVQCSCLASFKDHSTILVKLMSNIN